MVPPDFLVLTAANPAQAAGYRRQLAARRRAGRLPAGTRTLVVADPGGRRVGSGGATLVALRRLLGRLPPAPSAREALAGRRVFLVHAGGDSRRLPAYAAEGKAFLPLPCPNPGGPPVALLDRLLDTLSRVPAPPGGHLLVAAGDVLLTLDPAGVDCAGGGVTGFAFPGAAGQASRHGVYVAGPGGRVAEFLQKPAEPQLRARGALGPDGLALIDSGWLSLAPDACAALCAAAGLSPGGVVGPGLLADLESGAASEVDLYEEIALALAGGVTPDDYARRVLALPRNADPGQQARLRRLYDALHGLPFRVRVMADCEFFHPGTSAALLAGLTGPSRTAAAHGFRNGANAALPPGGLPGTVFAFNSVVEGGRLTAAGPALLEGCDVRAPLDLSGDNVVTGLGGDVSRPLRLPVGVGLLVLPVGRGEDWSAAIYGLGDGFGGGRAVAAETFLGAPLDRFLDRHSIPAEALWPGGGPRTLYHARLWCRGTPDDVLGEVIWMLDAEPAPDRAAAWRGRKRLSLADLARAADHRRLLEHRAGLARLAATGENPEHARY